MADQHPTPSHLHVVVPEMRQKAIATRIPLPEWPRDLPRPLPEVGISEDGSERLDLMLKTGDRAVYFQHRGPDSFYDDIEDDPAWAEETPETRAAVVAYGRAVLSRYVEVWGEALLSTAGRAFTAAVWQATAALSA